MKTATPPVVINSPKKPWHYCFTNPTMRTSQLMLLARGSCFKIH